MRIRILTAIAVIAVVTVTSAGCSRKPPKHFTADKPAIEIPRAGLGQKLQAGEVDGLSQQKLLAPGKWRMRLEHAVSMRSTTMATTEVSTLTELALDSDAPTVDTDGEKTPFRVASAGAAVTTQQNPDAIKQNVEDAFDHLAFDVRTDSKGVSRATGMNTKKVPEELVRALMMMVPSLSDAAALARGPREVTMNLKMRLPGDAEADESLKGTWRVSGVSDGVAVMVFDYTTTIAGTAVSGGIKGRITQGEGRGRVVCRISTTDSAMKSSEWYESTAFSVLLKGDKSKRMLEQKVTSKALLERL